MSGGARQVLGALAYAIALILALSTSAAAQGPSRTTSIALDRKTHIFLLADVLEFEPSRAGGAVRFDGLSWIGGDYNRIYVRTEGSLSTTGDDGEVDAEVVYGRLVSAFWTAVVGGRVDARITESNTATRGLLTLGLEGLAPYWFEVEPSLYISQKGDVSARLTTEIDVLFTQRLIAQPRFEMNAALQAVPEFGVGRGVNDVELGTRLRYEIRREFAPYAGISWTRRTGGTAALARRSGASVGGVSIVAGLRLWY